LLVPALASRSRFGPTTPTRATARTGKEPIGSTPQGDSYQTAEDDPEGSTVERVCYDESVG
jgi:hypothetical protein